MNYIISNLDWIFSGAGLVIVGGIYRFFFKKKNPPIPQYIKNQNGSKNIQTDGAVTVNNNTTNIFNGNDKNPQNGKRFEMDERLLESIIERIESESLLQVIESVHTSCSYNIEESKKLTDFIDFSRKPTTKYFNDELNTVLDQLINSLNELSTFMTLNFFTRRAGRKDFYLRPDFDIDLEGRTEEDMILFHKYQEKLGGFCLKAMESINEYAYKSKLVLY
ncbi:hypothetical protein [Paenibacillus macquariensis]|uniref:Uncharacterized protein n=1 Tax=Paenibacillus macquariensis TaxID=948756 RepID=A0ABY1JK67_9BACL|nr:hypothetical protein [Paenibacillus macquariensis]MEC0089869.1 hypothetical protein [Paenibacillus macquariensis]OAB30668.1 hypothetical protein PMSM_21205 [Paenibacillus macquariensis subsp. macquariensis]SIQ33080.1 hypothetical protein SAMN05421578_101251 [Paenibacillus macquariensis]